MALSQRARFGAAVAVLCTLAAALGASGVLLVKRFTHHDAVHEQIMTLLHDHYYRPYDAAVASVPASEIPNVLRDRYTHYMDPEVRADFEKADDGTYGGIGLQAHLVEGRLIVTSIVSHGPAEQAGLVPGDIIEQVDGQAPDPVHLEKALRSMRGVTGTQVAITVRHRSSITETLSLVRADVQAKVVDWLIVPHAGRRVARISVTEFSNGVGDAVRAAVGEARRQRADGIVLDLRKNGGGFVDEAVDLVSAFVPAGTLVTRELGQHIGTIPFFTELPAVDRCLPVAILVDGDSASASEMTALALRDATRATLIGTRSFGKGVVQNVYPLSDGGAFKLTVAEYVSPAGTHVNGVGLEPDVVVVPAGPAENVATGDLDNVFDAAVTHLGRSSCP